MDRQLESPLLIKSIGSPVKLNSSDTYSQLQTFLRHLQPSPALTQLERLNDALGVEIGLIAPSEGERREAERLAVKSAAKAERRRKREEVRIAEEQADMEAEVEGLQGIEEGDEAVEAVDGVEGEDM